MASVRQLFVYNVFTKRNTNLTSKQSTAGGLPTVDCLLVKLACKKAKLYICQDKKRKRKQQILYLDLEERFENTDITLRPLHYERRVNINRLLLPYCRVIMPSVLSIITCLGSRAHSRRLNMKQRAHNLFNRAV